MAEIYLISSTRPQTWIGYLRLCKLPTVRHAVNCRILKEEGRCQTRSTILRSAGEPLAHLPVGTIFVTVIVFPSLSKSPVS
jgi:hypothetical protein